MAAQLRTVARHVLLITAAHCAVLLALGSGVLMPPEQTSILPPSSCVAPPEIYRTVGILNFFFVPSAIGTVALAGVVASHHQAAAPGAGGAGAATKAMLRALTVMAIILSATSAGIAMAASFNILQAKAGSSFSCMSASVRAPVYASYLLVGPILLLCYLDLARMALLSE